MNAEVLIGLLGLLFAVGTYFAGLYQGRRQEQQRRAHDIEMEHDRRLHELASKMADEYVRLARGRIDNGPHALSRLGLDQLNSDALIRSAIGEMNVRSGADPWAGQSPYVEDIDLVAFFRQVREKKVDFLHTPVEAVANEIRAAGQARHHNL